jgi:hypothetical protein
LKIDRRTSRELFAAEFRLGEQRRWRSPQEFLVNIFIVTKENLRSLDHDGPPDQIRLLGHESDGLGAGRRIIFHPARSINLVPRIQKVLVIAGANQFIEVGFAQPLFVQIAQFQFNAAFKQETSRFSAGRSRRFL